MVAQSEFSDPSTLRISMGNQVPMFLGVPMKTIVLAYHVMVLLLLIKLTLFDELLTLPYFVLMFGIVLLSYIRIDAEDKAYMKFHFWICLLFSAVPAAVFHVSLIGVVCDYFHVRHRILVTVEHTLASGIFLMFFGVYIWMCHKVYRYFHKKPILLPFHSDDMYEVNDLRVHIKGNGNRVTF